MKNLMSCIAACVVLAGCGGGSSPPENSGDRITEATASLGPSGGKLTISAAVVELGPGLLGREDTVTLRETQDQELSARFRDGTWMMEPSFQVSSSEIQIETPAGISPSGSDLYDVQLTLPEEFAAHARDGGSVYLLYLREYASEGEEQTEAYDTAVPITLEVNAAAGSARGKVPQASFMRRRDGSYRAVLKLGMFPRPSDALLKAVCPEPAPAEGPQDGTQWVAPIAKQLKIVGPFGEPGHSTPEHTGVDFRTVPEGLHIPVRAVRNGFIERIQVAGCAAPGGAGCANGEDRKTFYVTVRHPDRSVTRYKHLKNFSAVYRGMPIGGTDATTVQQYWTETNAACPKYPVRRGNIIALSGWTGTYSSASGAFQPHLHLEYAAREGGLPVLRNPITRLGQLRLKDTPTPVQITAPGAAGEALAHVGLFDYSSDAREIVVRRKKRPEVFLPVTARGGNFPAPHSHWPVLEMTADFRSALFLRSSSQVFPTYFTDISGLETDNGGLRLRSSRLGTEDRREVVMVRAAGVHRFAGGTITPEPDAPLEVPISVVIQGAPVWSGPMSMTECVAPRAPSGDSLNCNYAFYGGVYSPRSGFVSFQTAGDSIANVRIDHGHNGGGRLCTNPTSVGTSSFTRTVNMTGILLFTAYGTQTTNIVYTITSRSPTQIAGTVEVTFNYPDETTYNPYATDGRFYRVARGVARGTFTAYPQSQAYPPCIYGSPANLCLDNGDAWKIYDGRVGRCRFAPLPWDQGF